MNVTAYNKHPKRPIDLDSLHSRLLRALTDNLKNMDELEYYRDLNSRKGKRSSLLKVLLLIWPRHILRLCLAVISIYFYINYNSGVVPILIIGLVLGGTIQDVGWLIKRENTWPSLEKVIDWERVKHNVNEKNEV